jgi:adenylosuccinate synthase
MEKMRRGNLIIDLQFGSTGKGLIAGFLAERDAPDTIITAWAANAGHTYIDKDGRKFVHTMLANGIVSRRLERVLLGPGSVIDPVNLAREIEEANPLMSGVELYIHPSAAIITQQHRDEEAGPMTKIGSTKKGCGAAAIHRIRRDPDDHNTAAVLVGTAEYGGRVDACKAPHPLLVEHGLGHCVVSAEEWQAQLASARVLQVEGAQGYSLSMYHGFYPFTTSRDVSVHQMLADCGIPVAMASWLNIVGTARTFPIRVANRFDEQGKQVGYSGPVYDDQQEITFESIGQPVELTTVTKLPRRIFTFSHKQMAEAVRMNGVRELFLNFVNYLPKDEQEPFVDKLNDTMRPYGCTVKYLGFGPTERDVHELDNGSMR